MTNSVQRALEYLKLKLGVGFALTSFEKTLIEAVKEKFASEMRSIFKDQLSRFNRVNRYVKESEELDHGFTAFYWMRRGKSERAFPRTFPHKSEEQVLASVEVVDEVGKIDVRFMMVNGIFFVIEYRSIPHHHYQPSGKYSTSNVEVFV